MNWFDIHAGSITAFATIVLAVLTAGYLYITYRLSQLTSKQITSDIKLSRIYTCSNTYFLPSIKKGDIIDGDEIKIFLSFNAFNSNVGPGSFERPILQLFKGNKLVLRIYPTEPLEDQIVYLVGGEDKKIVQRYIVKLRKDHPDDERLFRDLADDRLPFITYQLAYRDNTGRNHMIKDLVEHESNEEAEAFFR